MFRRGGFAILVKRVARYEVIRDGETTVEAVPSPETGSCRQRVLVEVALIQGLVAEPSR